MLNNYNLQQYFLDMIKEFSISNPDKEIDSDFIYSRLMGFNIKNSQHPYEDIGDQFYGWMDRYKNNKNIKVSQVPNRKHFLWFINGRIKGNEIKLYIPLDIQHLKEGANQLFDFLSKTNIEHESKIAKIIRNDNIVVRVNTMDDARTIIDYVCSNPYLSEGLMKVNPFLPNCNGVGLAMDNNYSYNGTVCKIISDFFNLLKSYNKLELFTVSELNKYIKNSIPKVVNEDLRDIYSLISKTTDPNFELQDFVDHANYKLCDKYDSSRKRVVSPKFYFEQAIKVTDEIYPQNAKRAILEYIKGNPMFFTNQEKARDGLKKYVHPGDVINLMRTKLSENNVEIPKTDNELVDQYINILLNKEVKKNIDVGFSLIKRAYINTLTVYDKEQARHALKVLILYGDIGYFTNKLKDRDNLKRHVLRRDVKKIILNNIDIENLDINNIDEIVNRFENAINTDTKIFRK